MSTLFDNRSFGRLAVDQTEPELPVTAPSHDAWAAFLSAYSKGDWSEVEQCPIAADRSEEASADLFRGPAGEFVDHQIYSSIEITPDVARNVRRFVLSQDYLPPPRSPHEGLRKSCILEYDILGPAQKANVQNAVDTIAAFFPGDVITTFTLFDGHYQTLAALGGNREMLDNYALTLDKPIGSYNSLCGHAVLQDQLMFVPDLALDWRFRSNPYVDAGILSCIGSPVSLMLDSKTILPNNASPDVRIGIGAIIILFVNHRKDRMSDTERLVVNNVTSMLETQLRATWESQVRVQEAQTRKLISDMIEDAFVIEQKQRQEVEDSSVMLNDRDRRHSTEIQGLGMADMTRKALERLSALLPHVSGLAALDISPKHLDAFGGDNLVVIAKTAKTEWDIPGDIPRHRFTRNQNTIFGTGSARSGLESIFGSATNSHLLMPFFTSDQPVLAIVATSGAEAIRPGDAAAIRSVGSVLVAKEVQQRVVAADSAKTAFLSSISHELRTPMHSISAGIDIANAAVLAKDWEEAESALSDVRSCGSTLQKILNDVLDYGRTASPAGMQRSSTSTKVDLVTLLRDTAHACILQYEGYSDAFSVELEYPERDWLVKIDEAKYYRLVVNGLTNALKFCKLGPIVLSLSARNNEMTLCIRDSGAGFEESSIPRLLEPFTKDDWHTPGAGLGLHITNKIAQNLGGHLSLASAPGVGTTFKVTTPIRFISDEGSDGPYTTTREILRPAGSLAPLSGKPPRSPTSKSLESRAEPGAMPAPQPLKILVVDDNTLCRRILVKGLRKSATPVEIREAADGQAALEAYIDFAPDLVLTDVSMPVMDGVTSAQLMRIAARERQWPDCKIYAITGLGSADPRLKSVALHGTAALDGWLVKGHDDLSVICRIVAEVWKETSRISLQ